MARVKKFKPNKIIKDVDKLNTFTSIIDKYGSFIPDDWDFYLVDQVGGNCWYTRSVITIPLWAMVNGEGEGYLEYYICHEIAHIKQAIEYTNTKKTTRTHGREFMSRFKEVCPQKLWHHELGYNPRMAKACGIKPKQSTSNIWDDVHSDIITNK